VKSSLLLLSFLIAIAGCDKLSEVQAVVQPVTTKKGADYPEDFIEWVYKDSYADQFLKACNEDRPGPDEAGCKLLLYRERAKQVWAAEAYEDLHAEVKDDQHWQVAESVDKLKVMAASQPIPDKFHRDDEWITLADIYKLSEQDREFVTVAITRHNTLRWNDKTKTVEPTLPEQSK